ncbi:MAG: sulfur carrier protein ThiS [Candidatus Acididesulfobacter guangdongensis]|uniref:Sulfur carrier protein ThiS n=1 Tax=Acididesulfobacter guangdongensis TaxID=2597225 RepID=A0A519BJD7_ACIG2|nr:MAG: sulfur carrier protein ThiS [Candidatus Acididesulfobacter guangdongensis]
MLIYVNDKEINLNENLTIAQLIDTLNLNIKSTAAAVNKEIVPKAKYAEFILKDKDRLDLVTIAPGG